MDDGYRRTKCNTANALRTKVRMRVFPLLSSLMISLWQPPLQHATFLEQLQESSGIKCDASAQRYAVSKRRPCAPQSQIRLGNPRVSV